LAFIAVGEVGGVDEAESGGGKQLALFALAGGVFDQRGGIPLAEKDLQPLQLQPAFEQVNLRGLAGAIQSFHGNQSSREPQFRKSFHSQPFF